MNASLFFAGIALFIFGFAGAVVRRSFLSTLLGGMLAFMGVAMVFCHYALAKNDASGMARAILFLLLGGCLAVSGAGLSIAIYRRRGTVNLDELRELSG